MPNPLAALGDSIKSLAPIVPRLSFAPDGNSGISRQEVPVFFADGLRNMGFSSGANTPPDWDKLLGDPMNNSVVAAAVNAICMAVPEATLILEKRDKDNKWVREHNHDAITIFDANPDLSESELWQKTAEWKVTKGWCPWVVFYNKAGTKPVELWPWQPERVRYHGDENHPIASYEVQDGKGDWRPLSRQQVIHFRHTLGWDLKSGYTPLWAGKQQMVGAQAADTYQTALVLNSAVSSWLISIKQGEAQGRAIDVTPEQFDAFIDGMRRKYTSNKQGVGGIDGTNLPLEITRMAWSPNEMSIDKLHAGFVTSILSLIGVSRKLLDLGDDPTYLNLAEAIKDFWQRRMKPDCNKSADTLNRQLLPLFGLSLADWRYRFDYSGVAGLQESEDSMIARWKGLYDSGGIDLYTLHSKINLPDVPKEYKNLFVKPPNRLELTPVEAEPLPETKSINSAFDEESPMFLHIEDGRVTLATGADASEAMKRFDPTEARDKGGRWTSGGTSSTNQGGKGARATRDLKPGTIEDAAKLGVVIPKGSTNIQIATDAKADVLASYTQTSDKPRTVYHPDWNARQDEAKYARINDLHADLPDILDKVDAEIAGGGAKAHQALTVRLILKTGLRNGGKKGGGKVEAFGASSLLTSHARVDGDKVSLDFIGKEGVRQRHAFVDADLANHIRARQAAGHEAIFDGDATKTLKYLGDLTGDKYKVHDLRTLYGTALAADRVEKITAREGAPKTAKELKDLKNRVGKTVGAHLGNNASMSLSNYIAPQVFHAWEAGVKSGN